MPTARKLILQAMSTAGIIAVGENPIQAELDDALDQLNQIIGKLNAAGLTTEIATRLSTAPAEEILLSSSVSRLLGVSVVINNVRVGYRVVGPAEWADTTRNFVAMLDGLGSSPRLRIRPAPIAGTVEADVITQLSPFPTLDTNQNFSPGIEQLLRAELAFALAVEYGRPVTQEMAAMLSEARQAVVSATAHVVGLTPSNQAEQAAR